MLFINKKKSSLSLIQILCKIHVAVIISVMKLICLYSAKNFIRRNLPFTKSNAFSTTILVDDKMLLNSVSRNVKCPLSQNGGTNHDNDE